MTIPTEGTPLRPQEPGDGGGRYTSSATDGTYASVSGAPPSKAIA